MPKADCLSYSTISSYHWFISRLTVGGHGIMTRRYRSVFRSYRPAHTLTSDYIHLSEAPGFMWQDGPRNYLHHELARLRVATLEPELLSTHGCRPNKIRALFIPNFSNSLTRVTSSTIRDDSTKPYACTPFAWACVDVVAISASYVGEYPSSSLHPINEFISYSSRSGSQWEVFFRTGYPFCPEPPGYPVMEARHHGLGTRPKLVRTGYIC